MKSFKDYLADELLFEETSQEIEKALQELNIVKAVTTTFKQTVKSPLFKKAVVLWKKRVENGEDPHRAASKVALLTDRLSPREFTEYLQKLKLLSA